MPVLHLIGISLSVAAAIISYILKISVLYRIFLPFTVGLIILLCIQSKTLHSRYSVLVLSGLIFGIIGDIFTMFRVNPFFLIGGVSFVLGHVCYIILLFCNSKLRSIDSVTACIAVCISSLVLFLLWNHLGEQKPFILIYAAVITIVLWRGMALFYNSILPIHKTRLLAFGMIFFYTSDILLAIERYLFSESPIIQIFVILFYLCAQTLIALTCYNDIR